MLRLFLLFLVLTVNGWAAIPKNTVIVIDPGHGGKDLGTHSKTPRYLEKELTLITAKMVASVLQKLGYKVVFTRTNDIFVALDERAAMANDKKAHLFVSIHFNSAPNQQAKGIEIYYYGISSDDPAKVAASKKLAKLALDQVIAATEAHSRGIRHGNFAVIRETKMPAILVECGFLTNEAERVKLLDRNYLRQLSRGLAQGLHKYCGGI